MDTEDARRLSPAEQHERRRQVIRAYKRKVNKRQIARDVGLSYSAACKIIDRFEADGMAALAPRTRGRRTGDKRVLTAEQEACIRQTICDKRPEQLKMEFALWSRAAVKELIEREYQVSLHLRSVGKYLARWGFTPQKPIKRAYEQSPEAVRMWLDETYPGIAERAKTEGAEIHWGDETALVNTDVRGRSFAPKGKTPVVMAVGGTRQKLSMLASVTNQGKARWMIIDGNFNHEKLIEFFEALVADSKRKVFLILDNLGVHHCKPVKQWLAEHPDDMEVFYLPSYSPELNPEERLNADLKHVIRRKAPARTKAKLRAATEEHMALIGREPERVKAYFRDPKVKYAA
ncbi:IS630 family transposase [Bordetella sp. FB-8]|uniref:IS630 family transposase n=1 Tax=Bordetella sp. FB-8 TaxID=1159870 RepID=UPI00038008CC|nr:IS630 family transposase [Bordetella sp. FB-8]